MSRPGACRSPSPWDSFAALAATLLAACAAPDQARSPQTTEPARLAPTTAEPPDHAKRPGETGGPLPRPLDGEAKAIMARLIATHDDPERADLQRPGAVMAEGRTVAYDRYLLVGSTLSEDRGAAFARFVAALREHGGEFLTIESTKGHPNKVPVIYGPTRFVVAVQQW